MNDTLIIDARLLQTPTWSRGVGRYLLGLLTGLYEYSSSSKVILLFCEEFGVNEERIQAVTRAHPRAEVAVLPLLHDKTSSIRGHNAQIVDKFIHERRLIRPIFLQASLFTFDYFPFYPQTTRNTCIFYDMIPIKHWELFAMHFPGHEYFSRFKALYEADKIFSISSTVKHDLVNYLGFRADDIINIDGAYIPDVFREPTESIAPGGRDYKYVLLPGGDFPHKNMLRAIRGFDIFNAQFGDMYKLVITSFYSEDNKRRMVEMSPNIELVGQVNDNELRDLYDQAQMVLFPSLDEGLGLPILEAVSYGKKVVCSKIAIFQELSKDAFYYFDPYNPQDIGDALTRGLLDTDSHSLTTRYEIINSRFTWERTAKRIFEAELKVTPAATRRKSHYSIVVEQDRSANLTKTIGELVRERYKTHDINLFIDMFDRQVDTRGFPLIFNHLFPTRDISDVIKKTNRSERVLIYTTRSRLTYAVQRPADSTIYLGTNAKKSEERFRDIYSGVN